MPAQRPVVRVQPERQSETDASNGRGVADPQGANSPLKVEVVPIEQLSLQPEDENPREHTPANLGLIVKSIHTVGAGRSVVVNRNQRVVVGNATTEAAIDAGIRKVAIIHTDGNTLVAVQRDDLDPEDERLMALYDNRAAELADWSPSVVMKMKEDGVPVDEILTPSVMRTILAEARQREAQEIAEQERWERQAQGRGDPDDESGDDGTEPDDGLPGSEARPKNPYHVKGDLEDQPDQLSGVLTLKDDLLFDTNLIFDIPPLREDMLLDPPEQLFTWPGDDLRSIVPQSPDVGIVLQYATSCRTIPWPRTILCFYTDDKRFEGLWSRPSQWGARIMNAGPMGVITPNFSTYWTMPQAQRIWQVYRRRWVGRYLQECGLRVIPDFPVSAVANDWDFVWAGIPKDAPAVACQVQTFDYGSDEEHLVLECLTEGFRRLTPQRVLWYASQKGRLFVQERFGHIRGVIVPTLMDHRRVHLAQKKGALQ